MHREWQSHVVTEVAAWLGKECAWLGQVAFSENGLENEMRILADMGDTM